MATPIPVASASAILATTDLSVTSSVLAMVIVRWRLKLAVVITMSSKDTWDPYARSPVVLVWTVPVTVTAPAIALARSVPATLGGEVLTVASRTVQEKQGAALVNLLWHISSVIKMFYLLFYYSLILIHL